MSPSRPDRVPAGEDDVADVAVALVRRLGAEDPRVAAREAPLRLIEREERDAEAIEAPGGRVPDAVVEHEPAARRLDQRRREADLVRVPPRALARLEDELVASPVAKIGRRATSRRARPESCIGRWMSAKLPSMRRGSSAASLSSGCMTSPHRSNVRKSSVSASATPGPPLLKAVYAIAYLPELLDERDSRVLDPPQLLGVVLRIGRSVGSASMTQPSTPLAERAAHRCEWPRRSSTRQSRSVVPSARRVAPALKTVWTGYGQSAAVRMGFAGVPLEEDLVSA